MTKEQQALLEIVGVGISDKCAFSETLLDVDWQEVMTLASKQGVSCVCLYALEKLYNKGVDLLPKPLKVKWFMRGQKAEAISKRHYEDAARFASAVKPLKLAVLKGLDYAHFWPKPEWREFGDLDCRLVGDEPCKLDEACAALGLKVHTDQYKHSEIFTSNMVVENHYFFTSFAGSEKGRILEKELERLFEEDKRCIGDTDLLSPSPNFSAVFLIAHAQNHFFYEGLTLRQILDWYFFLQKESKTIDWNQVSDIYDRTGLRAFADMMTSFCVKWFGLAVQNPVSSNEELIQYFTEDILGEQMSPFDRRWWMMVKRMFHRYIRTFKFRKLDKMSFVESVWRTLAFSSIFSRKPSLEE